MPRRARRGQAAVLIALCLFGLVIFLALATNMGILVNDKVRMQSAADLGAYAAAYKEAQQLNRMVARNEAILEEVKDCRNTLTSVPWPSACDCEARSALAETYITLCELRIEALATDFLVEASWSQSVGPAMDAGMATMDANIPGLRSSGSKLYQGPGSASAPTAHRSEGTMFMPGLPTIASYRRVQDTNFNYPVMLMCPTNVGCIPMGIVPSARTHQLRTWYYKDDTDPDVWVMAEATGTMRSAYLDIGYSSGGRDGGYFGASSTGGTDRMYAVAVAKPYGGSVGPTAASPAQRNANTDAEGPYWTGRGTRFAKLTMVDEYRARMAGIGEWDSASASDEPRTALQLSAWGLDASKFRH
ncbi:MAG: hypothetical protein H6739_19080 [Alphaproteobacteria bacterium]|nr:hypothetical protein [Alphaproteobacteria bacterium]